MIFTRPPRRSFEKIGKKILKWGIGVVLFLGLASCASFSGSDRAGSDSPFRPGAENFASGSFLGQQLSNRDQSLLADQFLSVMNEEAVGITKAWQGTRSQGNITSGAYFLANVLPDPDSMVPARSGLDLSFVLETEQGEHVLAKNSNVRLGPSTDYTAVETLPSGSAINALGRVQGKSWMLVAYEGRVRGYVYEKLMVKAPGTGLLELEGGPMRQPYLCREFVQDVSAFGQSDRWQGLACDLGNGWELANRRGPTLLGAEY